MELNYNMILCVNPNIVNGGIELIISGNNFSKIKAKNIKEACYYLHHKYDSRFSNAYVFVNAIGIGHAVIDYLKEYTDWTIIPVEP